MTKLRIRARVLDSDPPREIEVVGQKARTLLNLRTAGRDGITALEMGSWAMRLAAYCHFLQRDHGLRIRCDRENHPGGWHGRHFLETPVEIISAE